MKTITPLIKVPIKVKQEKYVKRWSNSLEYSLLVLKKKKKEWKECMCRGSEGEEDREGNTKWLVVFLTSFPGY